MNDLTHYMRRPTMPLPTEMLEALGAKPADRDCWTWVQLTDAERDALWVRYPPVVTIGVLRTPHFEFVSVTESGPDGFHAKHAIERAWQAHAEDTGADPDWPVADDTNVITGPIGSVWRDGSFYPKGND
jgi:hypothetical protein